MTDLKLTAMLCSRLCHDLVGPIGAISNGIEILEDETDPGMRDQAIGLLARSAKQATGRLRFYRLAFGAAGGEEMPVSLAEARQAAVGMFEDEKADLNWAEADGGDPSLGKTAMRLVLNLILIAGGSLIRGGDLFVRMAPVGNGWRVELTASGPTVKVDEQVVSILRGEQAVDDIETRMVQPLYTSLLAKAIGSRIDLSQAGEGRLAMGAALT